MQASGAIGSVAPSTSSPFDDPIPVRKGKPLLTLEDAADYITKLPEAEQQHPAWQAAVEALIGRGDERPDDVRPDRHAASDQPAQAR